MANGWRNEDELRTSMFLFGLLVWWASDAGNRFGDDMTCIPPEVVYAVIWSNVIILIGTVILLCAAFRKRTNYD